MDFDKKLNNYAEILVKYALNVQPGQIVNISTEPYHREFAKIIAKAAYERGALFVNVDFGDPYFLRLRIEHSTEEDLKYVPKYLTPKYAELVDTVAANLRLLGPEDPDILSDLSPKKLNTQRLHHHLAIKYFYEEGIGKSKVHWTVAAASTPKWGQKVFPGTEPKEAELLLWEQIFKICRADKEDPVGVWKKHNEVLRTRAQKLTELKIKELHFTGPGTDLRVGLSKCAVFKGGTDKSPRGVEYEPNIPTEECFTTPDCRVTEGKVRATRPFLINGKLIKGLNLTFKEGQIVDFNADDGAETFGEYVDSDPGGRRLGEVALVGIDSPIYQSGLIFEEILFDENAACHIAVGSAYKFCLAGGAQMSPEELKSIGCNESSVHTDMMISSEHVDVTASTYSGESISLIKKGQWMTF
ncbi:MAG: aminopeptidase [Bdellovibrionales bacterium]|nr:aminopeptidase [Bdellovibrionales bacterium]